ncbi:HD-GYP domain-containing protein [Angustibacter luteus]|uniref:HD-GYP domain-containing protein n=1 Tax=Angustibacter luteus TaxID=658456 RepID=A0ABW1JI81_9ACTN
MTLGPNGPRLSLTWAFSCLAAMVAAAAVGASAAGLTQRGAHNVDVVVVFAAAIALGEALRVWLPGDREAAPIGTAAAVAFVLTTNVGPSHGGSVDPATVIAVVALATVVGILPHLLAGRPPELAGLVHRFLAITLLTVIWRVIPFTEHGSVAEAGRAWVGNRSFLAVLMLLAVAVSLAFDAILAATMRAGDENARLKSVLVDELRFNSALGSAIGCGGVLIALAAEPMGLLAVPVFLAPLLLTQFAFRRYSTIQETYNQTIRSLSRVTELGGYTETGHSRRVASLALAMGRDLGMVERSLRDLEYAALLHDIGQLSLSEPIPGGATVMAAPMEQRRIADLGADVVRRTGVLNDVADMIERQCEPYRRHHQTDDRAVPLGSRIIKAANAYDDLVGDGGTESRRREALERIHLGLAYEYDPRVVSALTRVVTRVE